MFFINYFRFVVILASASAFILPSTPCVRKHSTFLKMSSTEEPLKLNPADTAIVLIEYQNEFTTEGGGLHDAVKDCMTATGTLGNSRKVMDAAREAGATIIHVPIMFEPVSLV
jgi:hypothetical protein